MIDYASFNMKGRGTDNYYDKELDCIIAYYNGFLKSSDFIANAVSVLDNAQLYHTSKLIVDIYDMRIMMADTQRYIEKEWFPRAEEIFKAIAFNVPHDKYGEKSARAVNREQEEKDKIKIRYFHSMEDAVSWMQQLDV